MKCRCLNGRRHQSRTRDLKPPREDAAEMNGTTQTRSECASDVDNEGCQREPIRRFSTVRENAE